MEEAAVHLAAAVGPAAAVVSPQTLALVASEVVVREVVVTGLPVVSVEMELVEVVDSPQNPALADTAGGTVHTES